MHVGLYDNGQPGEIFVRMAKEGSTISGLMDSFATAISLALQHGVPLKLLVDKFSRTRFEPAGFTGNPEIPRATSIMDYLFRWLGAKFVKDDEAMASSDIDASGDLKRISDVVATAASTPAVEVVDVSSSHTNGNGHSNGNGHTNGNGQRQRCPQGERERQRLAHARPGGEDLQLHRPQRRPHLRGVRQHHGAQRELP